MSQGYKICPICGTPSHRNATICPTCGSSLTDVPLVSEAAKPTSSAEKPPYDRRYGETDLLEGEVHRRRDIYLFGGMLALLAFACVGIVAFVAVRFLVPPTPTPTETPLPAGAATQAVLATNTPRPSPVIATVTPPPPTPTNTATPGPCTHKVQPGDDLISIAFGCGHRSLDVLPLILELNHMSSPNEITVGQEIQIPWPTPTLDPNAVQSVATADTSGASPLDSSGIFSTPTEQAAIPGLELVSAPSLAPPTAAPSPTLLPGVAWHTVQPNENIVSIAFAYDTNIQVLSQLNPEITFSQCDYGNAAGGPECSVMIYAGQQVRVPVPTPTPTNTPTLSGSETPTPSLTPTFNAPSALSPTDRALFARNELITLRWVGSGTLTEGDIYRINVEDLTTGKSYNSDTTSLSFILPSDWQGRDGQRHDYRWTISVASSTDPDHPYFTTEPRLFTWEGR